MADDGARNLRPGQQGAGRGSRQWRKVRVRLHAGSRAGRTVHLRDPDPDDGGARPAPVHRRHPERPAEPDQVVSADPAWPAARVRRLCPQYRRELLRHGARHRRRDRAGPRADLDPPPRAQRGVGADAVLPQRAVAGLAFLRDAAHAVPGSPVRLQHSPARLAQGERRPVAAHHGQHVRDRARRRQFHPHGPMGKRREPRLHAAADALAHHPAPVRAPHDPALDELVRHPDHGHAAHLHRRRQRRHDADAGRPLGRAAHGPPHAHVFPAAGPVLPLLLPDRALDAMAGAPICCQDLRSQRCRRNRPGHPTSPSSASATSTSPTARSRS